MDDIDFTQFTGETARSPVRKLAKVLATLARLYSIRESETETNANSHRYPTNFTRIAREIWETLKPKLKEEPDILGRARAAGRLRTDGTITLGFQVQIESILSGDPLLVDKLRSLFERLIEDQDQAFLFERILGGECTPFLGAGACFGALPLASEISTNWAREYQYPLEGDRLELARVAQFLSVKYDPQWPKTELVKLLAARPLPNFNELDEPHALLSELPLPVYVTTNFDSSMVEALKAKGKRPRREVCRWNSALQRDSVPTVQIPEPTPETPCVFHLHGHLDNWQSLVLTEDDYLDFLVAMKDSLLPVRIREAWTNTTLLFLGYSLSDWSFRVLFRSIVGFLEKSLSSTHLSVQLIPGQGRVEKEREERIRKYLDKYFNHQRVSVYWGDCREFTSELRIRSELRKAFGRSLGRS